MIRRNIKLLKWSNFFGGLWFLSTLVVVYFETITHSYATAMLVFAFGSLMTTAMEIPMGLLSDKLGRRKTLIFATSMLTTCFLLWALAGQFEEVSLLFLGAVFFGISDAATSGTDEALIYETMEELGQKEDFDVLFSKSHGYNQIGLACSALSAAAITYFFSLQTLAWISVFPVLGRIIIAFLYIEPKRSLAPKHGTSLKQFLIAWRRLMRSKKARFYALIGMTDTAVGFSTFRFESVYYESLVALWLVNLARFTKQVFGTVGFFIIPKIKQWGYAQLFFGSMIGNIIVRGIGLILNNICTPFIMASVNLFYGPGLTASSAILQNEFSPQQRATMKSIISFGTGLLTAVVMYTFGVLADITSPRMAIILALFVKIVILAASLIILKKARSRLGT